MKRFVIFFVTMLVFGSVNLSFAFQESDDSNPISQNAAEWKAVFGAHADLIALEVLSDAVEQVQAREGRLQRTALGIVESLFQDTYNNMFASEDGNYLAHTKEELQTYNDLAMDYTYLGSSLIRTQLKLLPSEGIMIELADESGLGHGAGFRPGDIVLSVGDDSVATQYQFVIAMTENRGQTGSAMILRNGVRQELSFIIEPVVADDSVRWIIGVSVEAISPELKSHLRVDGAIVTSLTTDGPARAIGIKPFDVIFSINGIRITTLSELKSAVQKSNGKSLVVELIRGGKAIKLKLKPEKDLLANDARNWVPALRKRGLGNSYTDKRLDFMQFEWALSAVATEQDKSTKLDEISSQLDSLQKQIQVIRESLVK